MKHMNIVVSVIIAAAVLVAAYAVGLLVRYARTPDGQIGPAAVTPTEDLATLKTRVSQQSPGGAANVADSDTAARMRQEREQMLEKMKNMTKEEKRRFTEEQARSRFSAAGRGKPRTISPEEREKMLQKWQRMSEEEKRAFDAHTVESEPAPGELPQAPANAEGATTPQNSGPGGSEPNKAGQE